MKAIIVREHGGTDKLERAEVPDPELKPGQAIVRVRAVALNHLDIWVRRGVPGHKFPLPLIPGAEVAGVIDAIGPDDRWKPGDEVLVAPGYSCGLCVACLSGNDPLCHNDHGIFGESRNGGCAEKIAVPIRNLMRKPAALSFTDAAALPLDMLTAWHMLVARAQIRPAETVLVHAGGSGVGSAAMIHLAMATPAFSADWPCDIIGPLFYEDDIVREPLPIKPGEARANDKPGLGVELDEEKVERYRVK